MAGGVADLREFEVGTVEIHRAAVRDEPILTRLCASSTALSGGTSAGREVGAAGGADRGEVGRCTCEPFESCRALLRCHRAGCAFFIGLEKADTCSSCIMLDICERCQAAEKGRLLRKANAGFRLEGLGSQQGSLRIRCVVERSKRQSVVLFVVESCVRGSGSSGVAYRTRNRALQNRARISPGTSTWEKTKIPHLK